MNVDLEGFAGLEKALGDLPKNIGKAATRRAMAKAGEGMADAQRRMAPVDDGALRASIGVKVKSRQLDGLAEYGAVLRGGGSKRDASRALRAARRDARDSGDSKGNRISVNVGAGAPHSHLVEFGTGPRAHKSGKSTGVMPANPFIRPAFDQDVDRSAATIARGLKEEITKASARIARRAAKG